MDSENGHAPGDQSPSFSGSSMASDKDRPRRRSSDGNKREVPFRDADFSKRSKTSESNDTSRGSSPHSTGSNGKLSPSAQSANVRQSDEGQSFQGRDEVVTVFVSLEPLPASPPRVSALNRDEVKELEDALEFEESSEGWREDWAGNLAYIDHEISNPKVKSKEKQSFKQPLLLWALNGDDNLRLVRNLIRYVYHMPNTPTAAKKILAFAESSSLPEIEKAIRRTSIDPIVLREDGWTTAKSTKPEGACGGPFLIGDRIRWQGSDAVVIAYDHDTDIGDLWRAIWTDEEPVRCFDVEAEEVLEAKRKWERRQTKQSQAQPTATIPRGSIRFAVSDDFSVHGIEYGIVLAASFSKGARPGVYWPARVMHASEMGSEAQGKRSSSKQKLNLMFLAPYWNSNEISARPRKVGALSESGDSIFYAGPLLQMETIEASDEMIKEYPYNGEHGLDMSQLKMSFRFTGLPKAAFRRFVDGHRLALGLRTFAKNHLTSRATATDRATAGLFETHPLAVRAPVFPYVVLHLPFQYILSQLPRPSRDQSVFSSDSGGSDTEPVLQLSSIVEMMKPPNCWGEINGKDAVPFPAANGGGVDHPNASTPSLWLASFREAGDEHATLKIDDFVDDLTSLKELLLKASSAPGIVALLSSFTQMLSHLSEDKVAPGATLSSDEHLKKLGALTRSWALLKCQGEDAVCSSASEHTETALAEWRRASERVYKYMTCMLSGDGEGSGKSAVITDHRCNEHRTSRECFDRRVRIPAAMKAARLAGAGSDDSVQLITSVPDSYIEFVEQKLLEKAHSTSYLTRMKGRCSAAKTDDEVLVLTDDSDGNGGDDTKGSKDTWMAAVTGVAAAVVGVDMIVRGECVNVFCVTRPPGHHAGRSLHPMKAVSNGFCVLNPVACAAIHATTPISEGGLGLRRVCVIDFDVHHGNGTQDVLCSTYDPRYLYVSLHAGGPQVNGGATDDDDPYHELHNPGSNSKQGGIYPGRCGDTSPHKGVLNIPLGAKVTSHAVGTALISKVTPTVTEFAPDLIILSAGFDAHKSDPLNLGALAAEDFGHITEVACQLAFRSCSGRLLSVLEGGYSVPCCRPQKDIFTPPAEKDPSEYSTQGSSSVPDSQKTNASIPAAAPRPQPTKLLDLGDDLPDDMDDQVPYALQRRLEKCHTEGFVECVREHVRSLKRCNKR